MAVLCSDGVLLALRAAFVTDCGLFVTIGVHGVSFVTEWGICVTKDTSWEEFVIKCGVPVTFLLSAAWFVTGRE